MVRIAKIFRMSKQISPWVIGLTGSILSGKSTALAYFKQAGAEVISCDEIVRQLYMRPVVCARLQKALGTDKPAALAQLVFNHKDKRRKLEQILHPLVKREVYAQIKQSTRNLIIVEVPLLFEAGWEKQMDLMVCVLADERTLSARLKGRKLSRLEYERRLKNQLPPLEKAARADVVFFHANKAQLKKSVTRFRNVFKVVHNIK